MPTSAATLEILANIRRMSIQLDEVAEQGRKTGSELVMLRRELGLDGPHGRIPILETNCARQEQRIDKLDERLDALEKREHENTGIDKQKEAWEKRKTLLIGLFSGAGITGVAMLAKLLFAMGFFKP
jgi:hypothetical protein